MAALILRVKPNVINKAGHNKYGESNGSLGQYLNTIIRRIGIESGIHSPMMTNKD